MMGLLGDSFEDPRTMASLQLAAGLLSGGNFGQAAGRGLSGYQATMAAAQQQKQEAEKLAMAKQLQAAQMQDIMAQAELRKQQAAKMDKLSQFIQGMQGGAPSGEPAQIGAGAAPVGGQSVLRGIPQEAIQLDLALNDGKGIAQELFQRSRPNMAVHNGVVMDMTQAKPGATLPQIAQNGQASQLLPDPTAPGGYRVVAPPGALETYSAYQRAEADAKSRSELVEVYDPTSNRKVFVPKSAVLASAQQGPGAPQSVNLAQVRADLADPTTKFSSPAVRAAVQRAAAEQGGATASGPMAAGPSANETATAGAAKTYDEGVAKSLVEMRANVASADFSASSNIAKLKQVQQLLAAHDGGALSPTGLQIASAANSLGIKMDKNLPNKEAAQSIISELALKSRNSAEGNLMPGAISNSDRDYLTSMAPSLAQSAEGRTKIVEAQVKVLQRQQQVAQAMRNYEKKYGRLDNGFLDQLAAWSNANPLFGGK